MFNYIPNNIDNQRQYYNTMQEEGDKPTFFRKARMEDFLDDDEILIQTNKHNKNQSHNDNKIEKNQQEFGNKKRIKP